MLCQQEAAANKQLLCLQCMAVSILKQHRMQNTASGMCCAALRCAALCMLQGAVRQPDAQTDPRVGHVGPVNDLVACGPYICSAGESKHALQHDLLASWVHVMQWGHVIRSCDQTCAAQGNLEVSVSYATPRFGKAPGMCSRLAQTARYGCTVRGLV
jgi:hypothetical protein